MLLEKILKNIVSAAISADLPELDIKSISLDSRKITPGSLFVAVKGAKFDGNKFIADAIDNGAVAVLSETKISNNAIAIIQIDNLTNYLSDIAKNFFSENLPDNLIAVTGTNGKTSICIFLQQLLNLVGQKSAAIGTSGIIYKNKILAASDLTTPDIFSFYQQLADLKSQKFQYVAFEASSHGLQQGRIDGVNLAAAGFSNLSQDHLDYHLNMDEYFKAKSLLFEKILAEGKYAIINADSKYSEKLYKIAKQNNQKIFDYGYKAKHLRILEINQELVKFSYQGKDYKFSNTLLAEFQNVNLICAISFMLVFDYPIAKLLEVVDNIAAIAGRFEVINYGSNKIIIDYAHTPDALKNLLLAARLLTNERLFVLFGCGGERDEDKRAKMGIIANDYSDIQIVTDDNPRHEDSAMIRKEIIQDFDDFIEYPDRSSAIKKSIEMLKNDDVLVIAGKGDENYQIIGDKKIPCSDREHILNLIT